MTVDKRQMDVVGKVRQHDKDTGSLEVQVVALSNDIARLTRHFATSPKDFSSKQGLFKMLNRRRKFLKYLKKHNEPVYMNLIDTLGLKAQ